MHVEFLTTIYKYEWWNNCLNFEKEQNFTIYTFGQTGSGKTYTLSLNFIALSLIGSVKYSEEYYRKILAITFTNKAASEMKDRVLEYLEVLSDGKNKDSILDWLKKNTYSEITD